MGNLPICQRRMEMMIWALQVSLEDGASCKVSSL